MSYLKGRRLIRWENIKGPKQSISLVLGTSFGAGLFPVAPGTMGTLVGLPIAYFTNDWDWPSRVALWGVIFAIGTWAATVVDQTMGTSDNQNIVIDETLGYGITAWTAAQHPWTLFAAFVFFRFFDIVKPPPVRQIDYWSKKKSSGEHGNVWWGGFGVIADDAAAGVQALLVILILQRFGILL